MAERAERVEFVPLSLDPAEVSWVAPGRSLAALRAGRSMSLPSTPSASIPLALADAADDGRLKPGKLVLMTGMGAGLTWGSALIEWTHQTTGAAA